jgi:hypothetical protein
MYARPDEPDLRFSFLEGTGFEFGHTFSGREVRHSGVYAFAIHALPRRSRDLTIRIMHHADMHVDAVDMRISNPFFQPSIREWTPETLPVTRTSGEVKATLQGLDIVQVWPGSDTVLRAVPQVSLEPTANEWAMVSTSSYWFEDATGNKGQELSPFEPAWKVCVVAQPDTTMTSPDDVVHRLGRFRIPLKNHVDLLDTELKAGAATVTIHCLSGGGVLQYWSDGATTTFTHSVQSLFPSDQPILLRRSPDEAPESEFEVWSYWPCLVIEHPRLPEDTRLAVRAFNNGTPTAEHTPLTIPLKQKHMLVAPIAVSPGTSDIVIEVVAMKPARFDFFVEPPHDLRDAWTSRDGDGQERASDVSGATDE